MRNANVPEKQPIQFFVSYMPVSYLACAWLLLALLWILPACHGSEQQANNLTGGNAARGVVSIRKYGCGSCHTIPGVTGAHSKVGPNLSDLADRSYIAGVLTNSPDHLMEWIQNPQAVDDKTAMPNLHVTASDARDIAGYLYTLR